MKTLLFALTLMLAASLNAQDFSFDELVGTWNGNSYSQTNWLWNASMTLVIEADGYYTDSSGILMPTIYPETQQVEYSTATNRVHFRYLSTVYSGMYFYTHFYYEVIYYDGVTLHLAYNFWDDPEPHPDTQLIILAKEGAVAEGTLEGYLKDFDAGFSIAGAIVSLGDYSTETDENGYFNMLADSGTYELTVMKDGHQEYADNIEIIANNNLFILIDLQHMYNPPENLVYQIDQASIFLQWEEPVGMNLSGYHVYRDSEVIGFVTDISYMDSDVAQGTYSYAISAVYGDYISSYSNQVIVEISNTSITEDDYLTAATKLLGNYPNPFNPETTISFSISKGNENTEIVIYNLKGQRIKTLVNKNFPAGQHSVVWNGMDENGNPADSGVYLYRMKTGSTSATKKMVLRK